MKHVEKPSDARTPLLFLVCVMLASTPFHFMEMRSLLPEGMRFIPISALMTLVPVTLAAVFVLKERGWRAMGRLLARAGDARKIWPLLWWVPTLLTLPVLIFPAYHLANLLGADLAPMNPIWEQLPELLLYFVLLLLPLALAEELGWMGYAADPLQKKWGTLGASVIIGFVWAAWHWIPWYVLHQSVEWIVWQTVANILLRALIFWLYNNTSGSVLAAALCHASFNIGYRLFPDKPGGGTTFDPLPFTIVLAVALAVIILVWGAKTLARGKMPAGAA